MRDTRRHFSFEQDPTSDRTGAGTPADPPPPSAPARVPTSWDATAPVSQDFRPTPPLPFQPVAPGSQARAAWEATVPLPSDSGHAPPPERSALQSTLLMPGRAALTARPASVPLEPLDIGIRDKFQPIVRQMGERFPGIEIESRSGHTDPLREGIKGVNWLTILGTRWVKEIGGIDYLHIRLGDDFRLTPYDGGLMIQAGPKPQIGDVKANRWPGHYVTLAKVLKPIQIKDHGAFHFGDPLGSKRMDGEASMAWLFRFDGK